ncbi:MAG: hypothetical protein KBA53_00620 [Thermoclostridium sp.]|nr:hypothetical protein [Thermoclostridium sp.]
MSTIKAKNAGQNLCWLLVKNRLTAQLGMNVFRYEKDKRKRTNKIATTVAILVCLVMAAVYCSAMAYGYAYMGLTELIPGIALMLSSLMTLFFTMFKTNGELFGFKDYDRVMSLPIPVRTVINSRFINMYLWNTFFALIVMVPMGIIYAIFAKPTLIFYLLWFIGLFLSCLIPTTIAAVFGAVITAISSKSRYASAIATTLSIVFVIAVMVLPTLAGAGATGPGQLFDAETGNINEEAFSALAPMLSDTINRIYPPAMLFTKAVINGNILSFMLFTGISVGWYALFILVLSMNYKQINTALTTHRSRADYKLETLQQGSMRFALYKKTILRILKSTICATNLLIGCVLAVLLAAAMLIVGPEKVIQGMEIPGLMDIAGNAAGYIIAAIVVMTNTAVVSLALEGKNIWLIKSLPIPPKTLYDSYLMTNLTFTVPTSLVCSLLFSISLKTGFIGTVLMFLTPLCFSLFTATAGIFIGNRMAYYNWQDVTQLVKGSLMSMLGMLGGTLLVVVCGVIANSGILPISATLVTFVLDILFLVLAAVLYVNESKRPVR